MFAKIEYWLLKRKITYPSEHHLSPVFRDYCTLVGRIFQICGLLCFDYVFPQLFDIDVFGIDGSEGSQVMETGVFRQICRQ